VALGIRNQGGRRVIPEAAVEALARVLAEEALFDADCGGYGWDAEKDSSDHFMPRARSRAREYLEAAAPHIHQASWTEGYGAAKRYYTEEEK